MELPEDVLNEILDNLELNEFVQFTQINNKYNISNDKYWKKFYHQFNFDIKNNLSGSYKELVQILDKVSKIIDQAKLDNVYIDLKEPIVDPMTLTLNSRITPNYRSIDSPLVAIELRKIESNYLSIILYSKKSDFKYIGTIERIKTFLSYLIYYGRI